MRRSLAKSTIIGHAVGKYPLFSSSGYSSSAGGGGRGRGSPLSSSDLGNFQAAVSSGRQTDDENSKDEAASSPLPGIGHGRGKPFISTISSRSPSPSSTISSRRGRGSILEPRQQEQRESSGPKKPIFFLKEDDDSSSKAPIGADRIRNPEVSSNLPSSILDVLMSSGAGRGKPSAPSPTGAGEKAREENRHLRQRSSRGRSDTPAGAGGVRMNTEEARKKAMGILSKGGHGVGEVDEGRERGGRGGGRRGVRGRGRRQDDEEDDFKPRHYLGDNADAEANSKKIVEKITEKYGPEIMNVLEEAFEEAGDSVLPSQLNDAFDDASHTNYLIECEPEYLMEEFGTNPDIDEKPPISLRDALEKMKPFLMAYEGIQNEEEWEEVMEETMEQVPLIKEIVDSYSGPDRVTAKRQNEELQRVANTLPQSTPTSVKTFTDRALLSLQSNPGWGFDKKCQFMDKLVWEVSQQYK